MRSGTSGGWLLAGMLTVGCAHQATYYQPSSHREAPRSPPRAKLAVLPVDGQEFPDIAASLNNALHDVKVKGIDDYFLSKATLEVVQLQIECIEPSSACYVAVGRQLSANKLLLGQIVPAGKRKRDKSVRVTITLFDVDAGEPANVVERVFRSPELASQGAGELIAEAAADPPRPFGPSPEPEPQPQKGSMARGGRP
jgi:hypothetical protein